MNCRIKKKHAKPIIEICKQIQTDSFDRELFWYRGYPDKSDYDFTNKYDYYDYLYEKQYVHENRALLYKIVKKAYRDRFPIQDYALQEIPYSDNEGCFVYFCSKEENCGNMICFWVEHKGKAIPYKSDNFVDKGNNLFPQKTCQEAVWDDFE